VDIDSIISDAQQILPSAFTNQSPEIFDRIPPAEIADAQLLTRRPREDRNRSSDVVLPFRLPEILDQFSEVDREDAVEAEAIHRELGFDIFATYVSFHTTGPGGRWGIFYRSEGIRRLSLLLMRNVGVGPVEAERVAFNLLRAHERFHFRFDLGALYDELVLKTPLYNAYSKEVYQKIFRTADCFEESLANRALILFRNRDVQPQHRDALDQFVRHFCKNSPPGYRDYDRNPTEMKECLLGQLRSGKINVRLSGPQQEWLANFTRRECPEYLVISSRFATGRFLRIKSGGRIWIIHRSDLDPWPSKPHAHDYERRQKLDLRSGDIFSLPGRNQVEKLRRKDFLFLREQLGRQHPDLELPPLSV
jgi:hypothetical protein